MWHHLPNLAGNWCFQVPSGVLKRSKLGKASNSNGRVSHYNSSRHHRIRTCLLFISRIIYIDIHQNMIHIYFNKTMYIYIFSLLCPRHFPNISCIETWSQADVPPVDHQAALQEAKKAWRSNDFVSKTGQGVLSHSTGLFFASFCGC